MISPGQKLVLDFPVKVVRGSEVAEVKFRDLLRRRTIVSVYMKNRTPSCDRQVDSLVAHADEFARADYDMIAISRDTGGSHRRYAEAKAVPFPLVSDPEDRFAQATDSVVRKSMYGRTFTGPARAAYVLEPDGTVLGVIPKVDPGKHAAQLLELLRML